MRISLLYLIPLIASCITSVTAQCSEDTQTFLSDVKQSDGTVIGSAEFQYDKDSSEFRLTTTITSGQVIQAFYKASESIFDVPSQIPTSTANLPFIFDLSSESSPYTLTQSEEGACEWSKVNMAFLPALQSGAEVVPGQPVVGFNIPTSCLCGSNTTVTSDLFLDTLDIDFAAAGTSMLVVGTVLIAAGVVSSAGAAVSTIAYGSNPSPSSVKGYEWDLVYFLQVSGEMAILGGQVGSESYKSFYNNLSGWTLGVVGWSHLTNIADPISLSATSFTPLRVLLQQSNSNNGLLQYLEAKGVPADMYLTIALLFFVEILLIVSLLFLVVRIVIELLRNRGSGIENYQSRKGLLWEFYIGVIIRVCMLSLVALPIAAAFTISNGTFGTAAVLVSYITMVFCAFIIGFGCYKVYREGHRRRLRTPPTLRKYGGYYSDFYDEMCFFFLLILTERVLTSFFVGFYFDQPKTQNSIVLVIYTLSFLFVFLSGPFIGRARYLANIMIGVAKVLLSFCALMLVLFPDADNVQTSFSTISVFSSMAIMVLFLAFYGYLLFKEIVVRLCKSRKSKPTQMEMDLDRPVDRQAA